MRALGYPYPEQPESDTHCWSCHKDEPQLFCTTCVRAFHISPVCSHSKKLSAEETSLWRCQMCLDIEQEENLLKESGTSLTYVNELLGYIATLLHEDQYLCLRFLNVDYDAIATSKVFNPLDLLDIVKKAENVEYTCYEAFWADVKWIEHNTKIHRSDDVEAVKGLKWLLKFTKDEIYSLRLCHECYHNANLKRDDWFVMPCTNPHLLVYAKQKDYPYWPSKLMAVNTDKGTVDVQFFGDHKRTIVAPKDCVMLSRESASINFGKLKDKYEESMKEVEMHIRNLIMRFGSFNFAALNAPLNATMLERHLYEMIPGAWKQLGHLETPAPIPKPISRRRYTKNSSPVDRTVPNIVKGRSVTRRMSVWFDVQQGLDPFTGEFESIISPGGMKMDWSENEVHSDPEPTSIRPSAVNGIPSTPNENSAMSKRKEVNEDVSPKSSVKKRKIQFDLGSSSSKRPETDPLEDVTPNESPIAVDKGDVTSIDQTVFKVPKLVARKTCANKMPFTIVPIENITTLKLKPHQPIKVESKKMDCEQKPKDGPILIESEAIEMNNFDSIEPNVEHQPEMLAICNAMVENNTRKMSNCIRSSLQSTLFGFLDAAKPTQQIQALQQQLTNQRNDYESMLQSLRNQNFNVSHQLNDLKGKFYDTTNSNFDLKNQNDELLKTVNDLKKKNASLSAELDKVKVTNHDLNSTLNVVSKKNALLDKTVLQLQETNKSQANQLKDFVNEMDKLIIENKALATSNAEIKSEVSSLAMEKGVLVNQMKDLETQCDQAKTEAFQKCANAITNAKMQQWCVGCGVPGGKYWCSDKCASVYYASRH